MVYGHWHSFQDFLSVLILRILITYTLSLVDYVFSAILVQTEWVQPQQIQIKRIVCKALHIPVRTPNKMLWAGLDDMGFAVPHVVSRLQCQYIKGLLLACNHRSTYTKETTQTLMLYPKPNIPPHPDWIVAQQWMAQHDVSFHLLADLTECPLLKVTSSSCLTFQKRMSTMHGPHL